MASMHHISSFYVFHFLADPQEAQVRLESLAEELAVKGLVIIAQEGMNGTVSVTSAEARIELQNRLRQFLPLASWTFKDSSSDVEPFRRFNVKIRPEIVTLNRPHLKPSGKDFHLSPADWDQAIQNENVKLLDTRNDYETKMGSFRGAILPPIAEFGEFSDYLQKSGLKKDEKILIFCTGGIRCEKAILEMNEQGYKNVWQLDGGILNYFEKTKAENYEGECFVFDHRVALDKNLQATGKSLCPHCGQPSDTVIDCIECGTSMQVCTSCVGEEKKGKTCSKNCAHHAHRKSLAKPSHLPSDSLNI